MPGGQHGHAWFGEQRLQVEPAPVEWAAQQRHVRAPVTQQRRRRPPPADRDLARRHTGVGGLVGGDHLPHQPAVAARLDRHDQPRSCLAGSVGPPRGGGDRVQGEPSLLQQHPSGGGQRDMAGAAIQQPHPDLGLKLPDGLGHRRLRHAEPLRRG